MGENINRTAFPRSDISNELLAVMADETAGFHVFVGESGRTSIGRIDTQRRWQALKLGTHLAKSPMEVNGGWTRFCKKRSSPLKVFIRRIFAQCKANAICGGDANKRRAANEHFPNCVG